MASETEYSNAITVAAYVEAEATPYFRDNVFMAALVKQVPAQAGSDSVKLKKAGSLTATAATESAAHAKSEYTETSPNTLLVQEIKVYVELTKRAMKFAQLSLDELAAEAGRTIGTKYDTDFLALLNSLTNSVGTTNTDLSALVLASAAHQLRLQKCPGPFFYVLHPTALFNVQADILTSSAPVFSNMMGMPVLDMQPPAVNGFAGNIFGLPVFSTTNTESINAGVDWSSACMSRLALAGMQAGGIEVEVDKDVERSLSRLAVSLWYDAKVNDALGGVYIVSNQS